MNTAIHFIYSRFHHFYLAIINMINRLKSLKAILLLEIARTSAPIVWSQNAANSLTTKLWQVESK